MCHLVGEVPVIGEENQSGAVFVEAADGFQVVEAGR